MIPQPLHIIDRLPSCLIWKTLDRYRLLTASNSWIATTLDCYSFRPEKTKKKEEPSTATRSSSPLPTSKLGPKTRGASFPRPLPVLCAPIRRRLGTTSSPRPLPVSSPLRLQLGLHRHLGMFPSTATRFLPSQSGPSTATRFFTVSDLNRSVLFFLVRGPSTATRFFPLPTGVFPGRASYFLHPRPLPASSPLPTFGEDFEVLVGNPRPLPASSPLPIPSPVEANATLRLPRPLPASSPLPTSATSSVAWYRTPLDRYPSLYRFRPPRSDQPTIGAPPSTATRLFTASDALSAPCPRPLPVSSPLPTRALLHQLSDVSFPSTATRSFTASDMHSAPRTTRWRLPRPLPVSSPLPTQQRVVVRETVLRPRPLPASSPLPT